MARTLDRAGARSAVTGKADDTFAPSDNPGETPDTAAADGRKSHMSFKKICESLYCRFQDDEVPAMGAQLTYYLILAFFPFLIFVIAVLSFTDLTAQDAINGMTRIMPDLSTKTIAEAFAQIQKSRSGSLLSIGIIATLWSASNGVSAVIKALNKAYDEEENRPFWLVKLIAVVFTIVLSIVIASAFALLIFGELLGGAIYRFVPLPLSFDMIWNVAQYAVPLVMMILVFTLLYRYTPNLKLSFREVLPGAIFATIGWIVTSLLFSFYVNNFSNYTKTYGSIGGIIVLLTWLYMSSIIIVLGGELNATLHFDRNGKSKANCKRFALSLPFGKNKKHEKGENRAASTHRL